MYICEDVNISVNVHMYIHICTYTCLRKHVCTDRSVYFYVCIYIYTKRFAIMQTIDEVGSLSTHGEGTPGTQGLGVGSGGSARSELYRWGCNPEFEVPCKEPYAAQWGS